VTAVSLAMFGLTACAGPPPLDSDVISSDLKSDVIATVGATLLKHGYVHGTDWLLWREYAEQHRTALDSAATYGDFGSAINAALGEFGVSYLRVRTPGNSRLRQEGRWAGLGIQTVSVDAGRFVTMVMPEGPANQVGIIRGDVILRANGEPVTESGWSSGVALDSVTVEWLRDGETLSAQLVFGSLLHVPQPELRWPRRDVAWLSVPAFSSGIYDKDTVEHLFGEIGHASALILDLRSSTGDGSEYIEHLAAMVLPAGVRIGGMAHREEYDEFLARLGREPKTILEVVNTTGQWKHTIESPLRTHYAGTLIVLVDGSSGTGGECLSASIQLNARGTVIGTTTAGRGLSGNRDGHDIAGGYVLFCPSAEMVQNDGSRIEGAGVQPDIPLSARQTADNEFILTVALWAIDAPGEPSPDAQIGLIVQ
jgi:C-terminal processing protease CtpA/Prc